MNNIHKKRIYTILILVTGLGIASALILFSLRQNINVFLTPSQAINQTIGTSYHFRLGGMVKKDSVIRHSRDLGVEFTVTDLKNELRVYYIGVLPDLFREGSGMIAEGSMNSEGIFIATQVLAKHDENYMPKNVYNELKKNARSIS